MKLKLHVFTSFLRQLEPFLVKWQTSAPMIPFLFYDIKSLSVSLCSKVVKLDIMAREMSIKMLCLLNFEDETNLLPVNQIVIGFSAKSAIKKVKHLARK